MKLNFKAFLFSLVVLPNFANGQTAFPDKATLMAELAKVENGDPESAVYGPIADWDVSLVTNMDELFRYNAIFDQDISRWNVGSVTSMYRMFQGAEIFNQDISRWNVGSVTSMVMMFDGSRVVGNTDVALPDSPLFNQDVSNWNVGAVKDMSYMFRWNKMFNQDISKWNVASVTEIRRMFYEASSFNQDVNNWNLQSVTDMLEMFKGATAFDQNLCCWDQVTPFERGRNGISNPNFLEGTSCDVKTSYDQEEKAICQNCNPFPECHPNPSSNPPNHIVPASASGDPHFVTFGGHKYDFHGGCDMVLVSHPNFANGLGFEVHIRTKISSWWSHIDTVVIRLGGHTLEIKAGVAEIPYWLNGVETSNMETGNANLGDHAIHFRRINDHQTQTRISLGGTDAVSIETWKKFVRVNMKVADPKKFIGAVGMLGSYPEGKMLGRDGVTIMEEPNEFGFEWQVKATEAQLFHNDGPVSFPTKCSMPSDTKSASRRLGEVMMTEDDAATACARVDEASRDACIFDVMATNDKDMAGSY